MPAFDKAGTLAFAKIFTVDTVDQFADLNVVAMVETVWVLDRAYGLTAREIAMAVERLLQVEVLEVENEQEVFTAMVALKQGWGSFADALLAELGARVGCTRTLTFDKKAVRLRVFELL